VDSLPSGGHDDDSNLTKNKDEENPSQIEVKRIETDDYL
jgi:hypothetical protein